jgi:PKD repeat protein
VRYYLSFIFLLIPFIVSGQLTAPGSNAVRYTSYPSSPGVKDPIFVFCNPTGAQKGSLTAESQGGTGPFNFTWYMWSDATTGFSILKKAENDVTISYCTELEEGGYRVNINDGAGYDTNLTGWIFLDRPFSEASLKNRTCDYVALKGKVSVDTFYYSNPVNGNKLMLPNGRKFLWSSNPLSSIPYPDFYLEPQTFNPPLEDVTYQLVVTDSMTCSSTSSFFYESIHVNADFEALPMEGEAPLVVTFTDKSIRGYDYKWEFGDDTESDLSEPPPHTYNKPGKYSVKLTIESELHCIDSLRSDSIVVQPSSMAIPNVFTPDGDGWNEFFKVESTSMRYISMEVYSRSGLKVYGFSGEGEVLREWKGWDGKINNSSIEARPGVYFYIIRALGWDNKRYDKKEYRGTVYLYR